MKLSVKALAITAGILWGAAILLTGIANLIWPDYGMALLRLAESVYPGYTIGGFGSVVAATLYAMLDGLIAGAIFAWLYNKFAASPATA